MLKKQALFCLALLLLVFTASSCSFGGAVTKLSNETSDTTSWQMTYDLFDGSKVKELKLKDGQHCAVEVFVTTEEGALDFAVVDKNGETVYQQEGIPTSSFKVSLDEPGTYLLKFMANNHKGSFAVIWDMEE